MFEELFVNEALSRKHAKNNVMISLFVNRLFRKLFLTQNYHMVLEYLGKNHQLLFVFK